MSFKHRLHRIMNDEHEKRCTTCASPLQLALLEHADYHLETKLLYWHCLPCDTYIPCTASKDAEELFGEINANKDRKT